MDYIETIAKFLGAEPQKVGNNFSWKVVDTESGQLLYLSVFFDLPSYNGSSSNLVSVQNANGYFELHNFKTIVPIEPNEIAFVDYDDKNISCLIVGQNATCSLFSNVSRSLLNVGIEKLDDAFLLSVMQLSLLEEILSKSPK